MSEQFEPLTEDQIERVRNYSLHQFPYADRARILITLCDMALASLSRPLPCGHPEQYAYSEDGGKNITCLLCERKTYRPEVGSSKRL